MRQPFGGGAHVGRVDPAGDDPARLLPPHEARVAEDADMLDDGGQRHGEGRGERAQRSLALHQPRQNGAPRRIGEGGESRVKAG